MQARPSLAGGLLLFALGALTVPASAAIVQIQASKDNTLYQDAAGSLSNGAGWYFFAGKTALSETRRGLIAFDVAGNVPSGSTINSATLSLYYDIPNGRTNGTRVLSLRRASLDWGAAGSDAPGEEGGGGFPLAGDATWLHTFYNTQFWSAAGGDFSGVTSASQTVGTLGGIYTWSGSTLTADVQSMLDAPASNFGWGLFGDETTFSTAKRFDSMDHPTVANRPVLTVDFEQPPVVPVLPAWGPLALATLLVVAAVPMLRRRVRVT